jgi:hypothetical protein
MARPAAGIVLGIERLPARKREQALDQRGRSLGAVHRMARWVSSIAKSRYLHRMPMHVRRKMTPNEAHGDEGLAKARDWCKIGNVFACTLRLHGRA